jgi:hypothetical protein
VADVRVQAGVATAVGTAHGAAVSIRAQAGVAAAALTAQATLSVGGAVAAVVDTIQQARPTVVDIQAFADVIAKAVREGLSAEVTAARIEQQAPMFGPVGRWLHANQGLLALLAFVATVVVGIVQIGQEADKEPATEQPPAQVVDPGTVQRTVEDGLREHGVRLTPPAGPLPTAGTGETASAPASPPPTPPELPHEPAES